MEQKWEFSNFQNKRRVVELGLVATLWDQRKQFLSFSANAIQPKDGQLARPETHCCSECVRLSGLQQLA